MSVCGFFRLLDFHDISYERFIYARLFCQRQPITAISSRLCTWTRPTRQVYSRTRTRSCKSISTSTKQSGNWGPHCAAPANLHKKTLRQARLTFALYSVVVYFSSSSHPSCLLHSMLQLHDSLLLIIGSELASRVLFEALRYAAEGNTVKRTRFRGSLSSSGIRILTQIINNDVRFFFSCGF